MNGQPLSRDHPRTCGEKLMQCVLVDRYSGSPPHMRGKVTTHPSTPFPPGITPAHAGKSSWTFFFTLIFRDHPRTCGEKTNGRLPGCAILGSPPHMRGKAHSKCCPSIHVGITPAHAGKRPAGAAAGGVAGDHPRTCGEKPTVDAQNQLALGSPPHMRGKACQAFQPRPQLGITPAHAGKRLRK